MLILKHGASKFFSTVEELIEENYYPEGISILGKQCGYVFGQGEMPAGLELVRRFENGWQASWCESEISKELLNQILASPQSRADVSLELGSEIE